jgi:hypothetical protein
MIKPEYIELMNQELDGTNSAEQSRDLEKYLSSHEEARAYYRELVEAVDVFAKVDHLSPPPGLGNSILAQVDQRAGGWPEPDASPRDRSLWASLRDLLRPRLEPAYAFTFLAGLAVGLAIFTGSDWLNNRHGTDLFDEVQGTANHSPWDLEKVTEGQLDLPGVAALYRTMIDGQDLRLHLKLRSQDPTVIKFQHGPQTTLQHFNSSNPAPSNLTVDNTVVQLNHRGRGSYDLVFHRDTENQIPIKMLVFSEGRLIKTQTLESQDQ